MPQYQEIDGHKVIPMNGKAMAKLLFYYMAASAKLHIGQIKSFLLLKAFMCMATTDLHMVSLHTEKRALTLNINYVKQLLFKVNALFSV